jgi:polysaccharide biosynthesis transport protein
VAEDAANLVTQIKKYVEFARRLFKRWWLITILTLIGAGGSVGYALKATRIYQSRTLISWKQSVNEQSIGMESRQQENWLLNKVNQLISSHKLLLKVAAEHNLYPGMRENVAPEVILEIMQAAIKASVVGNDSFLLSFEYSDPKLCQATTASLGKAFIEQNSEDKRKAAAATQTFIEDQVRTVKKQLDEAENKVARFVGEHPEFQIDPATGQPRGLAVSKTSGGSRMSAYYHAASPEVQKLLSRKGQLEGQLQLSMSPRGDSQLNQAQVELANARRQLNELRRKYTERHPDVQRAAGYVAQLEAQVKSATQSHGTSSASVQRLRDEIAELDAKIAKLSKAAAAAPAPRHPEEKKEIKPSGAGGDELTGRAKDEAEYAKISVDRTVARAKYDQIEGQFLRTKLAGSLEGKQGETEFSVVDPANLPGKPIRPSRVKIVLVGTALGIVLGLGLAALLVLFDPRIYNEDDLKKCCDVPLLAQIPKEA